MVAGHYRLQWTRDGCPYLLDWHRTSGIDPVDGCHHCQLLNRQPKPPPGIWRPQDAPGGAIKAKLGKDLMPEWGEADARRVLAEAYGHELAKTAYIRCRAMARGNYKNARHYRFQDNVSVAALLAIEQPALRKA